MKLNDYLAQSGTTMSAFAQKIGTTTATVSRVADGQVVPRKTLLLRIYEESEGFVTPNDLVGLPSMETNSSNCAEMDRKAVGPDET